MNSYVVMLEACRATIGFAAAQAFSEANTIALTNALVAFGLVHAHKNAKGTENQSLCL